MDGLFDKKFQLVIDAVIGGQNGGIHGDGNGDYKNGDITIDDLVFRTGCTKSADQTLPVGTTPSPPPNNCQQDQFVCDDASCVAMNKV